MLTRIRYKRLEDGQLQSPVLLAGEVPVHITLNLSTMTYKIMEVEGNVVVDVKGSAKTLQALKLSAKKAVKELGVVFLDEARKSNKKDDENKGEENV